MITALMCLLFPVCFVFSYAQRKLKDKSDVVHSWEFRRIKTIYDATLAVAIYVYQVDIHVCGSC